MATSLFGLSRVIAGKGSQIWGLSRTDSGPATLPLPTTREDYFLPGTQPHSPQHPVVEIIDPTTCRSCHSAPIYDAWRGSMMAQSGRDPIFWAAFAVAQNDAADAGEFCLRCHTPRGWYAGRSDPADGSALTEKDIDAGVACEVCHRMVDPVPGADDEAAALDATIRADLTFPPPANHVASGMIILDPQDNRRGPFSLPGLGYHTAFQARFQGQEDPLAASRLCGSCHNVDNPLLSWTENPPGGGPPQFWPNAYNSAAPSFENGDLFPIERTFDEWLNSDYAIGVVAPQFAGAKPDGTVSSCQDCHMVRQTGLAANPAFNPVFRDCNTTGCLPAHVFVGGNAWVPKILQDPRWRLHNPIDAPALEITAEAARSMLRRAATVTVELTGQGSQKEALVRVTNESGHKLPTGYPEGRRMWLNLRAYDAAGLLIYESGAYNLATGKLIEDPSIKVYEAKQGITPELAAVVGLDPGPSFHFALNNTTYKDNRIPPRGYTEAAYDRPGMRPVGATYADGQYWDDTFYVIPAATVRVVATLYYQTASSDYIDFLRELGGPDGALLGQLWDDNKSPPELVAWAADPAQEEVYLPFTRRP
ncbi:MAG: multiheme c-type cytochrome [Chloroflexota bacterium]